MTHRSRNSFRQGVARTLGALCLLPLLGGCVAAAAIAVPALTAIGAASRDKQDRAVTPAPAPASASAAAAPATAALATPRSRQDFEILPLTELPPPSPGTAGKSAAPWQAFLSYALSRAQGPAGGSALQSAILTPEGAGMLQPRRQPCTRKDKAVIIDLDRGKTPFAPEAELQPPAELIAGLSRLREAGVVVMWISALDANRVSDVAEALTGSGLDPAGKDPILLALGDADRKQELRVQAGRSACILAIAGDEREDFDELFGYLRNPAAGSNFDEMIGSGWFLVPDTLSAPAEESQPAG